MEIIRRWEKSKKTKGQLKTIGDSLAKHDEKALRSERTKNTVGPVETK